MASLRLAMKLSLMEGGGETPKGGDKKGMLNKLKD